MRDSRFINLAECFSSSTDEYTAGHHAALDLIQMCSVAPSASFTHSLHKHTDMPPMHDPHTYREICYCRPGKDPPPGQTPHPGHPPRVPPTPQKLFLPCSEWRWAPATAESVWQPASQRLCAHETSSHAPLLSLPGRLLPHQAWPQWLLMAGWCCFALQHRHEADTPGLL